MIKNVQFKFALFTLIHFAMNAAETTLREGI